MHVVIADSAHDLPLPNLCVHASRSVRPWLRGALRLLGIAGQSLVFCVLLWLLLAGPGFLSAQDSTVPAGTGRPAQASR